MNINDMDTILTEGFNKVVVAFHGIPFAGVVMTIVTVYFLSLLTIQMLKIFYRSLVSFLTLVYYVSLISFIVWVYLTGIKDAAKQTSHFLSYSYNALATKIHESDLTLNDLVSVIVQIVNKLCSSRIPNILAKSLLTYFGTLSNLANVYLQDLDIFKNETTNKVHLDL